MMRIILGVLATLLGLLGLTLVVGDLVHFAQYGVIDGSSLGLLAHTEMVHARFDGREPSALSVLAMWLLVPAGFLVVGIWMTSGRSSRREWRR